jgi:hypothetical protein
MRLSLVTIVSVPSRNCSHPPLGGFSRRARIVKAKPPAGLERTPTAPFGSLRGWKHHDSATGPEDIRCGGRNFGTGFDEIPAPAERGDQKFVFLCSPISGCHRQIRLQSRLSARPSGFVEGVGPGGGFDSKLSKRESGHPVGIVALSQVVIAIGFNPAGPRGWIAY